MHHRHEAFQPGWEDQRRETCRAAGGQAGEVVSRLLIRRCCRAELVAWRPFNMRNVSKSSSVSVNKAPRASRGRPRPLGARGEVQPVSPKSKGRVLHLWITEIFSESVHGRPNVKIRWHDEPGARFEVQGQLPGRLKLKRSESHPPRRGVGWK